MHMYDLIEKKKRGGALSRAELDGLVAGAVSGDIPDYQLSAFLMAVYFQGMTAEETADFTLAMAHSGEMADLHDLPGVKVDKHSTGGVGDKTTLTVAPIAAACGLVVAKMSGRGLGHTGGTVDKLESIPGFRTALSREEFHAIAQKTGICVAGQSGNLAPADKKLYALRDVTATVDSMPLIASSIMSKKLAAGADVILLDVKYGSGAFLSEPRDAVALAQLMAGIGAAAGRRTAALITDMDVPLGVTIGNSLEVCEAIETLRGYGPLDYTRVALELSTALLVLAGRGTPGECRAQAENALQSGAALAKFREMVVAQGGDPAYIDDSSRFPRAACIEPVAAPAGGYLRHMDTAAIGRTSVILGAGRERADEPIDHAAGIVLTRKTGDLVRQGDVLAYLHTNTPAALSEAREAYLQALSFGPEPPAPRAEIYAYVDERQVRLYE